MDGLIGNSIEGLALSGDAAVAASGELTGEQAKRFIADLETLGPMPKMADKIITGERYSGLDAIADLPNMMIDEMEDDSIIPSSISRAFSDNALDWDEILRTYNTWYDRQVEAISRPTRAERIAALEQLGKEIDEICEDIGDFSSIVKSVIAERSVQTVVSRKIAEIVFALLQPSATAAMDSADRVKSQLDVTRIAFALAAYRAERGNYPENLTDLSPDYLAEIPTDLFAQSDFRYARNDTGYLLYGVGQNCKDEQGRNYGMDYGHLDHEQIPEDAEMGTDDLAIRVPAEGP